MYSFSGATGTSRVPHNAHYAPYAQIRFDLLKGSTSESRQPHSRLQWRIRDKGLLCLVYRNLIMIVIILYGQ